MWAVGKFNDYKELTRDTIFPNKPEITEANMPDLTGRVYVVTGASAGIGKASAELLLRAGARVWVIGRTQSKLDDVAKELGEIGSVKTLQIKFEDPATIAEDVKPLIQSEKEIHGIIHNAGMNYRGSYYACGYLELITVNVIGPWVLQQHLDPLVLKAAKAAPNGSVRIVWVASAAHYYSPDLGGILWENISSEDINGRFGFGIYGQTKAMNIYQGYMWAKAHEGSNVISVSVHPGIVDSDIRRNNPDRNRNMATLCSPTIFGGYAEVGVLVSDKVTLEENGSYWRPYVVKGRIRPDVEEAIKGPRGEKFITWLTDEAAKIVKAGPQGPAQERKK